MVAAVVVDDLVGLDRKVLVAAPTQFFWVVNANTDEDELKASAVKDDATTFENFMMKRAAGEDNGRQQQQ